MCFINRLDHLQFIEGLYELFIIKMAFMERTWSKVRQKIQPFVIEIDRTKFPFVRRSSKWWHVWLGPQPGPVLTVNLTDTQEIIPTPLYRKLSLLQFIYSEIFQYLLCNRYYLSTRNTAMNKDSALVDLTVMGETNYEKYTVYQVIARAGKIENNW